MSQTLTEAVQANDVAAVDSLVARNPALVNARDEQGNSPVLTAVYYGAHDVARLLISRGARLDIHEAAAVGDARRVETLLADDPHLLNSLSHDGWTPLHLAAFFGHRDVAELLLDEGAEIHAVSTNRMENMPLHAAAANGRTDIVELLLDRGADVDARSRGWTALRLARENGNDPLAALLLSRGTEEGNHNDTRHTKTEWMVPGRWGGVYRRVTAAWFPELPSFVLCALHALVVHAPSTYHGGGRWWRVSKLLVAYAGLEERYELSTRELGRRAEQLRIINEVGRRILSVRHLEELLPFVVRTLYETFSCYSVSVWLKEETSRELVLAASWGGGLADGPPDLRFAYSERSIVVWVATHGESVLANDVTREPRYREAPGSERTRAEVAVPIELEGETIGVLDIEHTEAGAFEPSDADMLATVADQVALAIENARLWDRNRQLAIIEERNRLGREIHDTLAQNLTGITLQLEAAVDMRETKPERAWERVGKALDLARQGLDDVRRSVRNLRPAPLESRTLRQALADELTRVEADTGARTELEIAEDLPRLPAHVEDALYRIAQEALNNVRRHAVASQVRLTLEPDGEGWVRLRVRDNGVGFTPDDVGPSRRSFGLTSMRERAHLLGGDLQVRSNRNRSTVVAARVPVWGEAPR